MEILDSNYYLQYVEAIDESEREVSDWESQFIENILESKPKNLSEKQKDVIRRMADKYLGENIK